MSKLIALSIDVNKINKERPYQGQKGKYLNLTVALNDEPDQYGNHASAWEEQTKEEREAGQQKNYLGNGKVFWTDNGSSQPQQASQSSQNLGQDDDDLPF